MILEVAGRHLASWSHFTAWCLQPRRSVCRPCTSRGANNHDFTSVPLVVLSSGHKLLMRCASAR